MRITRTKELVRKIEEVVETRCDRCGKTVHYPPGYNIWEFTLEHRIGSSQYDSGSETVYKVEDLCSECMRYLFELLQEFDFTVLQEEHDW